MTKAEIAYAAAEREIERAIAGKSPSLYFFNTRFEALQELPPSISNLTWLTSLNITKTNIVNLSPLKHLVELKTLYLEMTPVSDLNPLQNITAMEKLFLDDSKVVNLSPLKQMTSLKLLDLDSTQVSDLSPLKDISTIEELHLSLTPVTDLEPLKHMISMNQLSLNSTQVRDLRPIRHMPALVENPQFAGLQFQGCRATEIDPEIDRISMIEDNSERARTLFAYLEDWEPPKTTQDALNEPPSPPAKKPSPLQPAIKNNRLVRNGQSKLPDSDALTRAEYGWQALKDYRDAFETAFNYGNYAPLPNMLTHFDRAMGDAFDPTRTISIGSAGERLIQLSQNEAFLSCLPAGIDTDFKAFAAQIALYVERFPDWKEYRSDTEEASTTPKTIAEEKLSFDAIALSLEESPDTDNEVSTEFRHELDAATGTYADEHTARGLLASASEVVRVQIEHVFDAMKDGALVRKEIEAMDGVADGEWAKLKFWAGGFTLIFLKRNESPLRRLAQRFPKQMGWTSRVLDYLFGPKPT